MRTRIKKMIAVVSAAALMVPMLVATTPSAVLAASDISGGGSSAVVNGTGEDLQLDPLFVKAIDNDDIDGTTGITISLDSVTPLSSSVVHFSSALAPDDIICIGACSGFTVNTITQSSSMVQITFNGSLVAGDSLVISNVAVEGIGGTTADYEGYGRLKVTTGVATDVSYGETFEVDARQPVINSLTSDATTGAMLKIGDTINFDLTTVEVDTGLDIVANYNNHDLNWTTIDGGITYQSQYVVTSGDTDCTTPLQLTAVTVTDINGNSSMAYDGADITNLIDANAPTITVTNPTTGSAYNSQPTIDYSLTDTASGLTDPNAKMVLLNTNGTYDLGNVPSGTVLSNVAEGNNDLILESTDMAGNVGQQIIHFTYDTTTPVITVTTSPHNQSILLSSNLIFAGTTEPNATVQLEIHSTPFIVNSMSDSTGAWRFEVPADQIGVGSHSAKLSVTDTAGNTVSSNIASFSIYEATTSSTKIYQSSYVITDDSSEDDTTSASTVSEVINTTDTLDDVIDATDDDGSIKASSTENEDTDSNTWETIVTVIAILIIAIGVGTAGYYAYEWWASKEEPVPLEPKKLKKKKKSTPLETKTTTKKKTKKKSSSKKGRW